MKKLTELVNNQKPKFVISVGDIVSQNMLEHGIQPHIAIVDNRTMREKSEPVKTSVSRRVKVENPAGTLTPETWVNIRKALKLKQPTQMLIEGEEDLLTLVAVLEAPENSLVVYGQPCQGVVAVRADKETKKKVQEIVDAMEPASKKLK